MGTSKGGALIRAGAESMDGILSGVRIFSHSCPLLLCLMTPPGGLLIKRDDHFVGLFVVFLFSR